MPRDDRQLPLMCAPRRRTASRRRGDQIAHGYRCPDCGHQWATARHLPAYSELHRRPNPTADTERTAA